MFLAKVWDHSDGIAAGRCLLVEPLLDLIDEGSRLLLEIEVPGILESDIDVTLSGRRLVFAAERAVRAGQYLHHEIERGILLRVLDLPFPVELVRSACEDGVLRLELKRMEER